MNRDNKERTDIVIAELRPREMWDVVCASDRQYLAVGVAKHTDITIAEQFAPVISLLGFDGFKHLALEWPERSVQPVIDEFFKAPASPKGETKAVLQMFNGLGRVPAHVAATDVLQTRMHHIDGAMIYAGKKHGLRVTALNPDMPELESYMMGETPEVRERFVAARNYHYLHERYPANLTPSETQRLDGYIDQHLLHNISLDRHRAEKFIELTGANRGAVMFGAAHFRGQGQQGIDDFLPQDDATYVMMGDSWSVQKFMEGNSPVPLRTPDFVLMTDLGLAYATPVARKNGLVP